MRKKIIVMLVCLVFLTSCGLSGENTDVLKVDEDISPELTYGGREELQYAREFALDYYDDYTLISISDGSRFLVVPEGAKVPEQLDQDIVIIERPLDKVYLVASAVMDMFRALDEVLAVRLSGTNADGWYIEEAKSAMEQGEILYAGKYSAPDYELILEQGCRLALENTMITHAPEVKEKLQSFGIPVLVDHSSYETHPMGRVEWIRLYGALLGKEEEALEIFRQQELEIAEAVSSDREEKTVAFFYITANGSVNVRKTSDYIPKMIELAGGRYIFDDLGSDDSHSTSMTMQMEEFYASAREADYLIYNSSIDGEVESLEKLLAKSSLLKDFNAVQKGEVFCTTKNLYQESMSIGRMISDIHLMLMGEEENMQYLYRLE
ncbi:MAG: ABC transporter substrate-binding protein [Bacillota bacterium]|nr:ABC transporter substrate-binding protein [Bacillota bacterium]